MFSNENGLTDAITACTTCSICGCKAASHIHMKAPGKETNTLPTASLKTPSPIFPSGSATTKMMSNSRSSSSNSTFTACPFRDHLKTRKERTEGTESAKDGASPLFSSTSKSRFDPADTKKKKESTLLKTARPSMLKPRVSASKAIIFNIGLYGAVSRSDAGTAKKLSPQEWQRMQMKNFIREISFPEDASTDLIATSIGCMNIAEFEDVLKDVRRQAKSESPSEPSPPPVADPKVTSDTEEVKFFDIEEFKPANFLVLIHMLENMTAPIQNGPFPYSWWTPEGTTHFQYTGFGITTTSILTAFRQYRSRSLPDVHFARIIDILTEDVLDHMKDFFDLSQYILEETWGSEQRNLFDLVFSLGPGGIDLVVKFLKTLFEEVEASGQTFITKFYNEALQVFTQLRELPTCLRYGGSLPPGRSNSIFIHDLTAIKLYSSSVPDIAVSLIKVGKYGLHYFFDHLVETVLDVLEVGGRRYPKILKLFESLCGALADKLKAQITGSSWMRSSPAPSTPSFTPSFMDHFSSFTPSFTDQSSSVSPQRSSSQKKTATPAASASSTPSVLSTPFIARAQKFATEAQEHQIVWDKFTLLLRDFPHLQSAQRVDHLQIKNKSLRRQYHTISLDLDVLWFAPRHRRYCHSDLAATQLLSLYSRSPGTNGVTAVLLITSLLSHSSSALRHLVALARLHGVHDLNSIIKLNLLTSLSCAGSKPQRNAISKPPETVPENPIPPQPPPLDRPGNSSTHPSAYSHIF
ncbi:hypothetical protein F5877DRAFT_76272 [Lentinula edodes]|nr:hypothetical protein F5877DRAFT_76272 [Lentinula edodes]